jgi:hypothetical protein
MHPDIFSRDRRVLRTSSFALIAAQGRLPARPAQPTEWNHCQPTWVKIILPDNPLRETVAEWCSPSRHHEIEVAFQTPSN